PVLSQPPKQRGNISRGRKLLLIGLVLFVVIGSFGLLFSTINSKTTNDNINATATAQTNATNTAKGHATATFVAENPDPYPPYTGKLVLYDPLQDNSKGYRWEDDNSTCAFRDGAYHVSASLGYYSECSALNTNFGNFAYQVQMAIIKGDCGVIIFRADRSTIKHYFFEVCQGGNYKLILYVDNTGTNARILTINSSSVIHTGLNQYNLIAVVANESTLDLYVNNQKIDSVSNNTYSYGQIAVAAD